MFVNTYDIQNTVNTYNYSAFAVLDNKLYITHGTNIKKRQM